MSNQSYRNALLSLGVGAFALTLAGMPLNSAFAEHPSFKHNIFPIIKLYCLDCHQPGGEGLEQSGLDLSSYESLMKGTKFGSVIVPGDAFSSNLMAVIDGRVDKSIKMPLGSYQQGPSRKDRLLLRRWINHGAKNDTDYKNKVYPVLELYCLECHQPGGKGYQASGFDVRTYQSLMKGTQFGPVINPGDAYTSNLMVLIEGRSSKKIRMPHVERRDLSKWEKHLIRAWINRGAKNN